MCRKLLENKLFLNHSWLTTLRTWLNECYTDFYLQVQATLNRIRASKNLLSQLQSEDVLDQVRSETRSKLSEQSSKKLAEKMALLDDTDDLGLSSDKLSVRKSLKVT